MKKTTIKYRIVLAKNPFGNRNQFCFFETADEAVRYLRESVAPNKVPKVHAIIEEKQEELYDDNGLFIEAVTTWKTVGFERK